jgi:hypothetical protein
MLEKSTNSARRQHHAATRLRIETLEARDCPSHPQVISFQVERLQGNAIIASGRIAADDAATATVRLSGATGAVLDVSATGHFSGYAIAEGFGQIEARAFDSSGLISESLEFNYQNSESSVNLVIQQTIPDQIQNANGTVGVDQDLALATLDRAANGYTTRDDSHSVNSSIGPDFFRVVDPSGPRSGLSNRGNGNNSPIITSFWAQRQGINVVLGVNVADEQPGGLVVTFDSIIPQVDGRTAIVSSNGSFSFVFTLKIGSPGGIVAAQTVDWYGAPSNIAYALVV